ncbi:MAG: serine hydrolase domain-containing protein [Solibacillus sp.]
MILKHINVEQRMNHYNVQGLSITLLRDDEISEHKNFGILDATSDRKVNDESIFNACSISKFLTAMAVMTLVDEGLLNLDTNVNEYLISWKIPNNNFAIHKNVTLRNLLSHQSGIIDPEHSFPIQQASSDCPSIVEILEGKTPYCKIPIEGMYEPLSEFHYSDAGYCIIQQVIEDVINLPFHHVINKRIFQPLAMNNSHFHKTISTVAPSNLASGHNKHGEIVEGKYPIYPYPAASGLWTTSTDLAKVVLELMHALKGNSKLGISKNLASEMIRPQFEKSWTGLGVFIDHHEGDIEISSLGWGVGFQCMVVALPYKGEGAVILTNSELGVHQLEGLIGEVYKALLP